MTDPRIEQYRAWLEKTRNCWISNRLSWILMQEAGDKFNELFPPEQPVVTPKCLTCGAEYDDWVEQFNCNDCVQDSFRYKGGME